jgi:Na+/melibiose symporter-like transporter
MGDSVSGWAQDRFKCCFSDKYGRLTPWVFIHFVLLIGTVLMAYCVPGDFSIIEAWFAIVSILGAWCNSTIYVCYFTALTALFPYKEQRSQVHGSTMIIALPGVFVGVFIYSMSLSNASTSARVGYAIVSCCFIILGGALSLPLYMRIPEKRKDDKLVQSSTWSLIKEIFSKDASRIIALKNLFDGGTSFFFLSILFAFFTTRNVKKTKKNTTNSYGRCCSYIFLLSILCIKSYSGRTISICCSDFDWCAVCVCDDCIYHETKF